VFCITAVQFASKLCSALLLLPGLIDGQACPVFQAISGHPGKPLAIRAVKGLAIPAMVLWPSRPSSDLLANLRQAARQKLGPTHCLPVQSPLSGSSAECRIIIEYQNALLSPVLLSLLQLFTSLLSRCCSLTADMQWFCFSSASKLVGRSVADQNPHSCRHLSLSAVHRKYSTVKEKYCKFVATVKI